MATFNLKTFKSLSVDKIVSNTNISNTNSSSTLNNVDNIYHSNDFSSDSVLDSLSKYKIKLCGNGDTESYGFGVAGSTEASTLVVNSGDNTLFTSNGNPTVNISSNSLSINDSKANLYIGQDPDNASSTDRLRLHHIRSGNTSEGSYIDYPDDEQLTIRAIKADGGINDTFYIKKGYSFGASGTVIKHSIFTGDDLPADWVSAAPSNGKQWQTVTGSILSNLPSFTNGGGGEVYRIICGFYYKGMNKDIGLNKKIIVRFSGAIMQPGLASQKDRIWGAVGVKVPGVHSTITRLNHSLNTGQWNEYVGGGGRGSSIFPCTGYVTVTNNEYPYFAMGISRQDSDDGITLWGYHSTVEIIETVA